MTVIIEDFFSSFLTLMQLWQTPEALFPKIYSPKTYSRSGHKLEHHQGIPYRLFYETHVTVRACHCVTNLKLSLCSRATFGFAMVMGSAVFHQIDRTYEQESQIILM